MAFVNNRDGMSVPIQIEMPFFIVHCCMWTESMFHDQSAALLFKVISLSEILYRLFNNLLFFLRSPQTYRQKFSKLSIRN